jgi:hypothetical protein
MLQKSKFVILMIVLVALFAACGIAATGEPGVGIDHIVNNGDGTFTIYLTDESSYAVGNFTGPQGPEGPAGPGLENIQYAVENTGASATSTSWADLSGGALPSVTFSTTGGTAIVVVTAFIRAGQNNQASMGFEVTGATTISPSANQAVEQENGSSVGAIQASAMYPIYLNSGSNTITAKYLVSGGTGWFGRRSIMVIPIELS